MYEIMYLLHVIESLVCIIMIITASKILSNMIAMRNLYDYL